MTVALVSSRNVQATGVDRYAVNLGAALARAGAQVERVDLQRKEWRVGSRQVGGLASLWWQRLASRVSGFEVVHALDPSVAMANTDVVTVHDLLVELDPATYQRTLGAKLDWRLSRRQASRAPYLIAVSEVTRQAILDAWGIDPSRVTTIHHGIDADVFHPVRADSPLLAKDKPTFVYVGDDNPRKNVGLVVDALRVLRRDHGVEARFVRVGPSRHPSVHGPYRSIAANEALDLVEPGFVPDDELPALLSGAAAFVWPTRAEGFGIPPLEAMACGAPVVALDTPINREVCGPSARYHQDDADALALALRDAAKGAPDRAALVAHARTFDWDETARRTMQVYEEARR